MQQKNICVHSESRLIIQKSRSLAVKSRDKSTYLCSMGGQRLQHPPKMVAVLKRNMYMQQIPTNHSKSTSLETKTKKISIHVCSVSKTFSSIEKICSGRPKSWQHFARVFVAKKNAFCSNSKECMQHQNCKTVQLGLDHRPRHLGLLTSEFSSRAKNPTLRTIALIRRRARHVTSPSLPRRPQKIPLQCKRESNFQCN